MSATPAPLVHDWGASCEVVLAGVLNVGVHSVSSNTIKRRFLSQLREALAVINPASSTQPTQRPTAERVIVAFPYLTRTAITLPDALHRHVTPLMPVQQHILARLGLPADLYVRLASLAPQALIHLRE